MEASIIVVTHTKGLNSFAQEEQRAPAAGDADMAERPSIEALQASARRREEDFATRKRARVADAGAGSSAAGVKFPL